MLAKNNLKRFWLPLKRVQLLDVDVLSRLLLSDLLCNDFRAISSAWINIAVFMTNTIMTGAANAQINPLSTESQQLKEEIFSLITWKCSRHKNIFINKNKYWQESYNWSVPYPCVPVVSTINALNKTIAIGTPYPIP